MLSDVTSRCRPARARGTRRPVLAVLAALTAAAFAAGCVSMPNAGPVRSYTVTQGPGAQSQPFGQLYLRPPGNNWTPEQIIRGFLTASASFANRHQVAREYMTAKESLAWNPSWSATVFSKDLVVKAAPSPTGPRNQATVTVTGTVQANLSGYGSYAVPSAKAPEGEGPVPFSFNLVKDNGQWRISYAPPELLLTSDLFKDDYQLGNLYFFDPADHYLVPDPVYVPLQATPANLMNGLVHDLITPPQDWLSHGATKTAFPKGTTRIGDVTLDGGTASVNLGGAIAKAPAREVAQVMPQVSAQLLWTLSSFGQAGLTVQSVEVTLNGKPWTPLNSEENPVQRQVLYSPPTGGSGVFYYLDGAGNLVSQRGTQSKPVKVAHVGTGYSQLAVSPDHKYLAVLRGGSLLTGPVGGRLSKRSGTGYTTISWDPADNLWATTGDQIVMLRGAANPRQPQGQPVSATVVNSDGTSSFLGQFAFTALRIAPDGVRVAIVVGGSDLYFGAIVSQPGARPGQGSIKIVLSPFYVTGTGTTTFSAVTWYGPDNVIVLGAPGPVLTEYPVDGGSSTSISAEPNIRWITASWKSALIAGLARGGIEADASLTGIWASISGAVGIAPAYPG